MLYRKSCRVLWDKNRRTILAENFIHKVFGIIILVVMLVLSKLSWDSIGFTKTKIVQNVLKGLALGVSCFSIAYLVECVLLYCMNGNVQLSVYTSGFSLNGEAVKQTGICRISKSRFWEIQECVSLWF